MNKTKSLIRKLVEQENKELIQEMKKENEEMKKQMEVEKEQIKNRYKNELEMKNREIEYKNKINRDYVNILKNDTLDEITKINVLLSLLSV